jgi:tRNA uridine 5-carboxymethylaminomethyl modification enzyme
MQEKLLKIRPRTLAHASSIPGVTPAAVSLVNVYIEIQGKRRAQAAALYRRCLQRLCVLRLKRCET